MLKYWQRTIFMLVVESLANFIVAATNVDPETTSPSQLSTSNYDVCATRVEPIPMSTTMTFRCDVSGRYVFVLRQEPIINFQLCEVEVYGEKRTSHWSGYVSYLPLAKQICRFLDGLFQRIFADITREFVVFHSFLCNILLYSVYSYRSPNNFYSVFKELYRFSST